MSKNPCVDYLSDIEFLKHMIPHHQMAVDMSQVLLSSSIDPNMIFLARNIKWTQVNEIDYMKLLLSQKLPNISPNKNFLRYRHILVIESYYPKQSEDNKTKCDVKKFFSNSSNHIKMKQFIDDKKYLKHMIPHHQVAVDMSIRVLKHTNNQTIIKLANDIITNQKYEIWYMNSLLKKSIIPYYQSNIMCN
jgi:uncharacterized protein (DUF305 family)